MYGNNFNNPFIMQNMSYGPMMRTMNTPMINGMTRGVSRGLGGSLRSLLGLGSARNGLSAGLRGINWSGLLGNASKALGVVNQAIPIVKEVGPMINNMKSMIKIASIFKDETDTTPTRSTNNNVQTQNNTQTETSTIKKESDTISSTTINQINNNEPNFFL